MGTNGIWGYHGVAYFQTKPTGQKPLEALAQHRLFNGLVPLFGPALGATTAMLVPYTYPLCVVAQMIQRCHRRFMMFNIVSVSLRPYQWSALVTSQEPVLQIWCSCRNIRCVCFVHPLKRRSKKLTSRAPAGLTYSYDTTSARDNQDASYWKMAEVGALSFRGTTLFRT